MESLQSQLTAMADEVKEYKRPTPNPAANTRAAEGIDAPARSLAHLQGCVDGLRSAIEDEYSIGIRAAKLAVENAIADFKATIERVSGASRWKSSVTAQWLTRGETICEGVLEEAERVLKKAEAREEAEAKVRIMESQYEELEKLTEQAGKQIPAEAETELLIDLEEEIGQRKETIGDLGRMLKRTAPEAFKDRWRKPCRAPSRWQKKEGNTWTT